MIITGLINQKGGVGKTTTSINLSAGLALRGHKTLLVDMDPQHNSSKLMGLDGSGRYIGEALLKHNGALVPMDEIIHKTDIEGLDIAPGAVQLSSDGELLDKKVYSERKLRKAVDGLDYEFVIIDSPPNLGRLTINVIYASDILLVPVKAGFLSIDAYRSMSELIEEIKGDLNPHMTRIFYTLYKPGAGVINNWADEDLEDSQEFVMKTKIRDLTVHEQAQVSRKSIFEFHPESKGAKDYDRFIEEFFETCQTLKN